MKDTSSTVLMVLILMAAVLCSPAATTPAPDSVEVFLSTADGSKNLTQAAPLRQVSAANPGTPVLTIDLKRKGQPILGLGASFEHATCENLAKLPAPRRAEIVEKLVNPDTGIGMNLIRLCIGTSDFVGEPYYTYNDLPPGETDPELKKFSIEKDRAYVLPAIKLAKMKNPAVLFFAAPWSPPAWMKTSGALAMGEVKRECYPAYARYLLKYIQAYETEGVPIHAITVQNEPHMTNAHYPTTRWEAAGQRDFIRDHLGPLFEQNKIQTRIWCWDHNWNTPEFPRTILADPAAARFVEGVAFHHYEGRVEAQTQLLQQFPDKHLYFTEGSVFGIRGALQLINILRHGSRSYNAWVIFLDEHRKPNRGPHPASATCIELLDDKSVRFNSDYFIYGQFMKFIQRGAVRVESSMKDQPDFGHVALLNPDGNLVLVTGNAGTRPQPFTVRCGGRMFEAELPARAVATYRWSAGK